jgi:predicted nucleic acid-binding protein
LIVIDASVLVGAVLGTDAALVDRLSREPALHAPELLPLEVGSVLRRLVLAGQLSERVARAALEKVGALPLTLHSHLGLLPRIWELRANLTVYDAAYVAIAEALRLPLVTSDVRLSRASGLRCIVELVSHTPLRIARV